MFLKIKCTLSLIIIRLLYLCKNKKIIITWVPVKNFTHFRKRTQFLILAYVNYVVTSFYKYRWSSLFWLSTKFLMKIDYLILIWMNYNKIHINKNKNFKMIRGIIIRLLYSMTFGNVHLLNDMIGTGLIWKKKNVLTKQNII